MSINFQDKPQIPLAVLKKLVSTLPPEEIAKLPAEKLPEDIPPNFVNSVPLEARSAVENLLMDASSHHLQQRLALQQKYSENILHAIDRSKRDGLTASLRIFKQKIYDLVALRAQRKQQGSTLAKDQAHFKLLASNIRHMEGLLMDVRAENSKIVSAMRLIRDELKNHPEDVLMLEAAIERLHVQTEQAEKLLSEYYLIRLDVNNYDMQFKFQQVYKLEEDNQRLTSQITMLREELDKTQALWKRALHKGQSNAEAEALKERIQELVSEQKEKQVAISENDLTLWLDTIVDASLHPFCKDNAKRTLVSARMALYNLLNKYCEMQEDSALQIARNPFLQVDAKQVIEYMLLSEQFILDYFAKKRDQSTAWISDMAQVRIEDLDNLEKLLVGELKRSKKFAK